MSDFGERRNSEGYWDPTPYQAIKNMVKAGEVWSYLKKDGSDCEVVVIASNGAIANILYLVDEHKEGCVECLDKWVNPRMINWAWTSTLGKCVCKMPESEFKQVLELIEDGLSVKVGKEIEEDIDYGEEPSNLRKSLEEAQFKLLTFAQEITKKGELILASDNEIKTLRIQLDMMKSMYSDLMEKFLQRV